MGCAPELSASPVIDPSLASYYQSQIGVLIWMVDLGWVDINSEVSMLDSFLYLPQKVHIEVIFHVYVYLCVKHNTRLALYTSHPDIDESQFLQCDWK